MTLYYSETGMGGKSVWRKYDTTNGKENAVYHSALYYNEWTFYIAVVGGSTPMTADHGFAGGGDKDPINVDGPYDPSSVSWANLPDDFPEGTTAVFSVRVGTYKVKHGGLNQSHYKISSGTEGSVGISDSAGTSKRLYFKAHWSGID